MSSMVLSPTGAPAVAPGRRRQAVELSSSQSAWLSRAIFGAVVGLLVLAILASMTSVRWNAPVVDRVDGHVMMEPGTSLREVAIATAPTGVSAEQQLRLIEELNGLREVNNGSWRVVLLPANRAVH